MIKFEIDLDLSWSKGYVIFEILRTAAIDANPNADWSVQVVREVETKKMLHFK